MDRTRSANPLPSGCDISDRADSLAGDLPKQGDCRSVPMFCPHTSDSAATRVAQVLRGRWIGAGALVDEFETAVAGYLGLPHAVAVNGAAAAIRLALVISGVGPGDEVISTPMTCTLTNHPILEQLARVVFADIQYDTGNLDPADVARRITPRTKAILCTHWGGQPADLDELSQIAEANRIPLIEDASEAFGASYRGRRIGMISPFTAFSFQAIQILNTAEGGMLAVRDPASAEAARSLRWFGIDRARRRPNALGYYDFDIQQVGYGYHMTNLTAAIGLENLNTVPAQKAHRIRVVNRYREALGAVPGLSLLPEKRDRESSHHFFSVHVEKRPEFWRSMRARGVEVSIVHARNDCYSVFGGRRDDLPCLNRFSESYIALPAHAQLRDEDVEHVIETVRGGW